MELTRDPLNLASMTQWRAPRAIRRADSSGPLHGWFPLVARGSGISTRGSCRGKWEPPPPNHESKPPVGKKSNSSFLILAV